jgi:hypothetical protein
MSLERHAFQTCMHSLVVFNSFFVLYVMCCFGNNPLYINFTPIQILFLFLCSVLLIIGCLSVICFSPLWCLSLFRFTVSDYPLWYILWGACPTHLSKRTHSAILQTSFYISLFLGGRKPTNYDNYYDSYSWIKSPIQ